MTRVIPNDYGSCCDLKNVRTHLCTVHTHHPEWPSCPAVFHVLLLHADRLVTVSVQLPDAYDSATNSLPANVSLHFTTLTTSFSGTNLTGDITYNWDFGDGITYQSIPNAAFSDHTYLAAGTFNLSVTASSPIGQVSNAASFSVYIGKSFGIGLCV